jgi:PHP family Zn ribbon phosphoesterase
MKREQELANLLEKYSKDIEPDIIKLIYEQGTDLSSVIMDLEELKTNIAQFTGSCVF